MRTHVKSSLYNISIVAPLASLRIVHLDHISLMVDDCIEAAKT